MRNLIPNKIRGFRSKSINALIDCVAALYPLPSATIRREFTTQGVRLNTLVKDTGGLSAQPKSFAVSISGYNATIRAGSIRTAWGNFSVSAVTSASPLVLSGSTAWIYVQAVKASMSATIQFSNSEPINTGANWQWPLVKATSSDGGTSYSIADGDIFHDGDFYFFSPINKP
jgi:hypothetical protein